MVDRRLELHKLLCEVLGSAYVYFQPPESLKLNYPCIVYALDTIRQKYADGGVHHYRRRYIVTIITEDPDTDLKDKLAVIPTSSFDRTYISDNLNHYVFTVYY